MSLKVVQAATELAPVAKVGGLGDVMYGLSMELTRRGVDVQVVVPAYDCLDRSALTVGQGGSVFESLYGGAWHKNELLDAKGVDGLRVRLLAPKHERTWFERGTIYGCNDDVERFLYWARAVYDWLRKEPPDVLHLHDWPTAVLAVLLRTGEHKERFRSTKVIFTIHNLHYQGKCAAADLERIGVPADAIASLRQGDCVNLLQGAITYADHVNTVSPTYAKEIMTPAGGEGLDGVLRANAGKFSGILNGIDTAYWDPEHDPFLTAAYSATAPETKVSNTQALRRELKLHTGGSKPLMATVARLVPQKGVELLQYAVEHAQELGIQYVLLGEAPDPAQAATFAALATKYHTHPDVRLVLKSEEALAHRIFAASDLFLVPSQFEPCGLTQLIAMRYGSVPIVRRTGGLIDTVDTTTGFCFDRAEPEALREVLKRACAEWRTDGQWQALVRRGMERDWSWKLPADQYMALYGATA